MHVTERLKGESSKEYAMRVIRENIISLELEPGTSVSANELAYMAQAFVNSDTTGTMTYTLLEQPTFTYRMVISSTENHALAGILTKAMYAMPQNLVEDLAAQYTTYKATELTLVDWIRLHPVVTVWVLNYYS